jgi:hypothetical protein
MMVDNTAVCTCTDPHFHVTRNGATCIACNLPGRCTCATPDRDPDSDQLAADWCRRCHRPLDHGRNDGNA